MFLSGIIDRALYDYDSDDAIDEDNMPTVLTELNREGTDLLSNVVPRSVFFETYEAETGIETDSANFLLALQTKRFAILTGISGTGKTRIAQALASRYAW